MFTEQTRVKEAQDNLYRWCLQNLPVGRAVTDGDTESIEQVKMNNRKSRRKLFGREDWVWYLQYKGWCKHGRR